jgi:protein-S-isoprenylcysteine O-methyltransferase Ste14
MLYIRGLIFTILVPFVVGVVVPLSLRGDSHAAAGMKITGALVIFSGAVLYGMCLLRFLLSGGTPAIFFTRPLRFLIGEEPGKLIHEGIYRFSRNPMYLSVLLVVFGQAIFFRSSEVAFYGILLWIAFHLVVVFIEEPHLRSERGAAYEEYVQRVPRWLGRSHQPTSWSLEELVGIFGYQYRLCRCGLTRRSGHPSP